MDRTVNEFVAVLRRHGFRVSPAETMDALRALRVVGLAPRQAVGDALRATLCKSSADIPAFDRLFELFFVAPVAEHDEHHHHHHHHHHRHVARTEQPPQHLELDLEGQAQRGRSDDHGEATPELRRFFDERRLRQTPGGGHDDTNRLRLSLFAEQLVLNRNDDALDRLVRRVTQNLRIRRARNMLMPGSLAPDAEEGDELPLDVTATEIAELVDQLADLGVAPELLAQLEAQADAIRAELPRLIKEMLARRKALGERVTGDVWSRNLVRVKGFSEPDRHQLESAIRRLAARLHGSSNRRRKRGRRGQISIPHTLRRNLRYDGMPFEPAFRQRRRHKPRLVVLCDVSLSTRNLARFWLQLVYQLQDLFAKVRTFVFVADIVDVTDVFRDKPFERAVEEVFSGRLLDVDVNSDFGRAIGRFRDEFSTAITKRTTVVILGDGRNNGRPPNEQALEEVSRLVRRVIWMAPEPRWGWSLGRCDLPRYEPFCARVEVVRTVEQLADVAEELVQTLEPSS